MDDHEPSLSPPGRGASRQDRPMTGCEGRITYTIPALGVVVVPGPRPGDVVIHRVDRQRLAILLLLLVAYTLVASLARVTARMSWPVPSGASMALERWACAGVTNALRHMDAAACPVRHAPAPSGRARTCRRIEPGRVPPAARH